ncbi:MAG: hypothetical protein L3J84_07060 [Gammaproteobacteria bacterium]|nr:hypothetical protein [Gammaproteobacteria bacterium]
MPTLANINFPTESALIELYELHLSELGYLLYRHHNLMAMDEFSWCDQIELEPRIAAHLDALALGEELAFRCSEVLTRSGDEDELLGAVYSLATILNDDQRGRVALSAFSEADDELLPVFVMALGHATHPSISATLVQLLSHQRPTVSRASAQILAFRQDVNPKSIWPYLHHVEPYVRDNALSVYAAMGATEIIPATEQLLFDSGKTVSDENLCAMLKLGSPRAIELARSRCAKAQSTSAELLMWLAMQGKLSDLNLIYTAASFPEMGIPALQALGVLGNVQVIPALIKVLQQNDDALKVVVADALQLMTGAKLKEQVTVPEEMIEELDPEDVANGEATEKIPSPRRVEITRNSTHYQQWYEWWQQQGSRFDKNIRWRHGQPFSVSGCIAELAKPGSTLQTRLRAHQELLLSGNRIAFHPEWMVSRQREVISRLPSCQDIKNEAIRVK